MTEQIYMTKIMERKCKCGHSMSAHIEMINGDIAARACGMCKCQSYEEEEDG